jgi:adenylate cyclase
MAKSLRFQSFTLDLQRLCLRGPAGEVDLRPKSFEVLRYLAEHAGRVVPKEEVIKAVWPDVTVTDESLTRCISEVRRAIGDEAQEIVKTISRRGYLFDSPDLAGGQTGNAPDTAPPTHRRGNRLAAQPASTDRPSIAVLPFANMSGDPEQEYFSDGITEDIITDLSKISGLFVVARNTTFTYKGKAVNIRQVSEDLNVKFILEGSVRKAGSRVRITAQLVDGSDGGHLWADRYDRDLSDIFMIQDEITRTIVDQLKVKLLPEENRALGGTPTESVEAYAYYLRGRQFLHRRSKTFLELARRMFVRATEIDPLYARAYAGIADCDSFLRLHYGAKVSIEGILAMGAKALELKSDLAEAHASRGLAFSLLGQYPQAMHEFDEAIALNANLFEAHYFCARACFTQGKLEHAATHYQRAADINPDDCQAMLVLVGVFRSLGRTQEMISAAREGVARAERELALHPENPRPAHLGAVALAELGELDRARDWAARAIAIDPDDVLTQYNGACFYSLVGDHDRAIDLLLAVLPRVDRQTKEWVKYDSDLNPLRDHPRFAKVLELLD